MFLKEHQRFKDGKNHHYYSLCETIRTERGPRHRRVCYLGEIHSEGAKHWEKTIEVMNARKEIQQLSLFTEKSSVAEEEGVAKIRLGGIRWERPRDFGEIYCGWILWERLGLDEFYRKQIDEAQDKADVPWSLVAAVLAINRLCEPRSELFIEESWYQRTALDDLLGVEVGKVNKDRLYRCLDYLIAKKDELEKHLKAKWGELFSATYDILLYDLTSTYFEGEAAGNPQAKRGYSRDHRPDCKQVVIALIVSQEGFPFAFEVMDGNRRDVTTLEEMLTVVENKYGYARRIWVFDRGVVSEDNLKALRKRKAPYVVGTARSKLKDFEKELTSSSWQKIREEVEVCTIPRVSGKETYVLIRSQGRREKEKAMRELAMSRCEARLAKLTGQVNKGRLKDDKKIHVRLGQILGRYPSVSSLYTTDLQTQDSGRMKFHWQVREDKLHWKKITEGSYLIRTNQVNLEHSKLWEIYTQLTEAEAAFRAIKSELMIRPIWHQKQKRVQAHILVAFLGYALWVTLKHSLKGSHFLHPYDYDLTPWKSLGILSRIKSGDIILPTTDGKILRLRRVSTPDPEARDLLMKLKIKLPTRLGTDMECSPDLG